jgi:hypothetical protein
MNVDKSKKAVRSQQPKEAQLCNWLNLSPTVEGNRVGSAGKKTFKKYLASQKKHVKQGSVGG